MPEKNTTTRTLRASAALAAAGAFNASPTTVALDSHCQSVTVWCTYTRGGSGGYATLRPQISHDGVHWYAAPILDGTLTTSAPYGTMAVVAAQYNLPAPGDGSAFGIAVSLDVAGARYLRIAAAEVGNTGAPGTLELLCSEDAS